MKTDQDQVGPRPLASVGPWAPPPRGGLGFLKASGFPPPPGILQPLLVVVEVMVVVVVVVDPVGPALPPGRGLPASEGPRRRMDEGKGGEGPADGG